MAKCLSDSATLYGYTVEDRPAEEVVGDVTEGLHDTLDEAKTNAIDYMVGEEKEAVYVYKVTITKVAIGRKPKISWEKP